ncbi:MAG: sulfotransferase domain-containing protein [Symploca sp. SIO2C1]|nr:sulfotransferase domain-containing protein [Symploca sp. SIO2C1]
MKAGTMFLHQLLADIAQRGYITHYSRNYRQESPFRLVSENQDYLSTVIDQEGCYGPFRHYFPLTDLENVKLILHFRDPRDVLTSMYFYLAYHQKHIPQAVRNTYIKRGIDSFSFNPSLPESKSWKQRTKEHVRRLINLDNPPTMADWFLNDYQMYFNQYLHLEQTTVLTYEEMVTNFPTWLPKFLSALSLENQPQLLQELLEVHQDSFAPPNPQSLDKIKHKRRILPGDHKQKMSEQTITRLNTIFSEQLSALGYEK